MTHDMPDSVDQIEYAGGRLRFLHNFRKEQRAQRRKLTRLYNHGASRGDRRSNFDRQLIHGPVPGRDKAANSNRLIGDQSVGNPALHRHERQSVARGPEMSGPPKGLGLQRKFGRRAEFGRNRVRKLADSAGVNGKDAVKELDAGRDARPRKGLESRLRRFHGRIHVIGRSQSNFAEDAFGDWTDHTMRRMSRLPRRDPAPVDIEPICVPK